MGLRLLAACLLGLGAASAAAQNPSCFAVESLPPNERTAAVAMLRDASDGEALYTLAGGLKPVSSDFRSVAYAVMPDTDFVARDSLARLRRIAGALRCGPLGFHVMEFAATFPHAGGDHQRIGSAYLVHEEALATELVRHRDFWRSLGVAPGASAAVVLAAVEHAPRIARWRGYGYLFGYPDAAVDFFVAAGASQDSTGVFVARDFRRIETFRKHPERAGAPPTLSSFVYAVPQGAPPTEAERALFQAAAERYAGYVAARARHRVEEGEGIVALWREWHATAPVDPFVAPRPTLQAAPVHGAIVLDGRLDEEAWAAAPATQDFPIVRPDYAPQAAHPTQVRVLYDERALYVGAEMRLPDGRNAIRVRDLRREFDFAENENFTVTIGPLGDRRTAYQFSVTPYGSLRDVQSFDGGDLANENWDALWRARTVVTDTAWYAEIAIPWETMRYVTDSAGWEINFLRNARHALETSAWAPFPRQFSSYRISYAGTLAGITPPPPRPSLRVRPFVLGDAARVADGPTRATASAGGEVIWSPDANTTVDLTVRTDFAQADVDRQVVNLERFSVFFPERRQFFLENSDVLGVRALNSRYTVAPFFSRTIGLAADGRPIPIDAGVRYAYRSAGASLGALAMRQAAFGDAGAANFGVVRGSRFLARSTRLGGLLAVRQDEAGALAGARTNVVTAIDGIGRIGEEIQFNAMLSTSHDEGRTGFAATYFAGRDTPGLYTGVLGAIVTRDYRPRTGFVSRPDVVVTSPAIIGNWQPAWRPKDVVWFRPAVISYLYHTPRDGTLQEGYVQAYVDVLHRSGALWYPYVERHMQRLVADFPVLPGVVIPAGQQEYWRYGWFGRTDQSAAWSASANLSTGGYFDGRRDRIGGHARWAPTPHVAFGVNYDFNALHRVGTADTSLTTHLVAPEVRLATSPRVQFIGFYQYNTSAERGALNVRLSWEFAPLSFVYAVYNDAHAILDGNTPVERSFILKLVWFGQL